MSTHGITPLQVRVGPGGPQTIRTSPVSLGRTPDNEIVVDHPLVSRRQLSIEWSAVDGWQVIDAGSTNGMFVGGIRQNVVAVVGSARVRLGDATSGPVLELTALAPARPTIVPASGRTPAQPQTPSPPAPSEPQSSRVPPQQAPRPPRPQTPPPSNPVRAQQQQRSRPMPAQPRPQSGPNQSGPNQSGPNPSDPNQSGPGRPRPTPPRRAPRFGELADAPHLAALHQNASAVFEVPSDLRVGRETIVLSGTQRIGRTPDNDIVVSDVLASRHHARVTSTPQGLLLEDLGSVNGTFVNGRRVMAHRLSENDVVTIGNSDFVMTGGVLVRGRPQTEVAGGVRVDGVGLTIDGKTLLNDISFDAAPGTLTAIIGPSGAGKSTISKIVAGLGDPTVGVVTFEGRGVHAEYEALRTRIGMVPQDDVLHRKLTLRQALRYAAELRLPADLSTADRDHVIDGVLSELQLTEHVDTRVDRLSGGQRKRASVAMELLTGPSLLILDEPTSGLDPALDRQVMQTLRRLADAGRVVLVVTHSLTYLSLCDRVLLLAPGGKTAFCGAPKDVGAELGTTDWAEIFAFTADHPDQAWAAYRHRHPHSSSPPAAPSTGPSVEVHQASAGRQASTVFRRQLRLILADRGYLVFLLLLPIVLGALTLVIPGENGFGLIETEPGLAPGSSIPSSPEAIQLLVVLVIGAAFMGAALTVRDLVGERPIFERERAVGLRPGAYLAAKAVVFFSLTAMQSAIMLGITYGLRDIPEFGGVVLPPPVSLFVAIAALACVSTLVGLAISSLVRSNEQTMPPLVIVVMVQLVFCGGLFPITATGAAQLGWIFPAYWGFTAAAQSVDVPRVNPEATQVRQVPGKAVEYPWWEPTTAHTVLAYGVLAVMAVLLLALIYSRLRLRKR
ncbi:ATP-binding cassette domain-containing protein [Gordonia humi]|uniref:ABC-type multidrug transport system ATPase subunit/pSer/pThr/pTyr-binding forkhead associated (FHA) protein n=1 Tax=Gordonia humi TaxID=686429 RepID=A0A840F8T6_9ACTN|nr:FHA domain-containing protein [Gordonia humi]MBB4136580.1 ABC-type multidrug transport system ATPase subunit/pSer/pThr/pTyr-binding forkhead associated (FHA) protein [Gordonia humi]